MHPQLPAFVLVTGPPGAGKTWVARSLADALELPLLEKDVLKETLGGALGITQRAGSERLGAAVFELLADLAHDLLRRGVSLIAEGNFTPASRLVTTLPPCRLLQVHVSASPDVLRERLRTRDTHRHPVHYDRDAADEIVDRARRGDWAELPLDGALVRVDTTDGFPQAQEVTVAVRRELAMPPE